MSNKSKLSLFELVQKHKNATHHIRIKIAPEMFHVYCRIMPDNEAKNLVCALLDISHGAFDSVLKKDPLSELAIYKRNQTILDLRCQGFSFASICETVKLSRVQVWRIIDGFHEQLDMIKFMESRKVKNTRLKYPELNKIADLRKKATEVSPSRQVCPAIKTTFCASLHKSFYTPPSNPCDPLPLQH